MRSSVEDAARTVADKFGYRFGTLTDGTIVLEPQPDPDCCGMCAAADYQDQPSKGHALKPLTVIGLVLLATFLLADVVGLYWLMIWYGTTYGF